MSQTIHHQLIHGIKGLSAAQARQLHDYLARVKEGLDGEALDTAAAAEAESLDVEVAGEAHALDLESAVVVRTWGSMAIFRSRSAPRTKPSLVPSSAGDRRR